MHFAGKPPRNPPKTCNCKYFPALSQPTDSARPEFFTSDYRSGDAANVVLAAVGYNFRLVLAWLKAFLQLFLNALIWALATTSPLKPAC